MSKTRHVFATWDLPENVMQFGGEGWTTRAGTYDVEVLNGRSNSFVPDTLVVDSPRLDHPLLAYLHELSDIYYEEVDNENE